RKEVIVFLAADPPHARVSVERSFQLPAGPVRRSFRFRVHAKYPDNVHLVVTRGATVSAYADSIDGLMGFGGSARPGSAQCRASGRFDVCNQPQEWCPVTDSRWRATVRKTSRAPAFVRVRFVFAG